MSLIAIRHITTYRYRQPVAFGPHRLMLRPRESFDQRLVQWKLLITPEPVDFRWSHDVFGNCVGHVRFGTRAEALRIESQCTVDHTALCPMSFPMEPYAEQFPFGYAAEETPDLARAIERCGPDPEREIDRWARGFVQSDGPTPTRGLLQAMTEAIHAEFAYMRRDESGIQDPVQTLRNKSGSCRDFALLLMEGARALGIAARFASGYLHAPDRTGGRNQGGEATHAWAEVYLPGTGWMGYDPTNGIIGNRDLIRVAVVRDPRQAVPVAGTFTGFVSDPLGMEVEVTVSELPALLPELQTRRA